MAKVAMIENILQVSSVLFVTSQEVGLFCFLGVRSHGFSISSYRSYWFHGRF